MSKLISEQREEFDYKYAMTSEEIGVYDIPNPEQVMHKLAPEMPLGRVRDYDRGVLWKTGYLFDRNDHHV